MGKKINKQILNLIESICDEHYAMSKNVDVSIAYLWNMRKTGENKGNYKLFIFLAEINLLTVMKFITEEEKNSFIKLLESEDIDNRYIAATGINYFRTARVKKYGEFKSLEDPNYDVIKDYTHNIINFNMFNNYNSICLNKI